MKLFIIILLILNLVSYAMMWIDKLKSIYHWWRMSESTLLLIALCGGVYGIWLGMRAPLYHKAGKPHFRLWIPIIALVWTVGIGIFLAYSSGS